MTGKQLPGFSDSFNRNRPAAARESDDDFDFSTTAHPGRELSTASLLVLAITTFAVWGGVGS
jgi:hypothetical protein